MKYNTKINLVDEYVKKLENDQQQIITELRKIINKSVLHLEESVKWGRPCYFFYGPVCYFNVQKNGVLLSFLRGSELADADRMLTEDGKKLDYIKIKTIEDISAEHIADMVREAVELNKNVATSSKSMFI
ncbi:MAG: DUF1801 domain-containing protein [Hymenobacteraceae bacterium]|nr:DUF1801 domain-containing protein [Hymenobacteraceae bacterium]MDX5396666.1 DUF1801 domain-containing protein [Hymenobacteraceae bacterium]MDX5442769.1 DUF1801 domain-containing protein [Hymenobacteraceae bacterium]MDX5512729.1 DUF1801 domain-containing protein [Hymenobacteraceae bacterium]